MKNPLQGWALQGMFTVDLSCHGGQCGPPWLDSPATVHGALAHALGAVVAVAVVAAEPGLVDGGCLVGWGGRAAQAGVNDGASRGQGGGNSGQGGNLTHGAVLKARLNEPGLKVQRGASRPG